MKTATEATHLPAHEPALPKTVPGRRNLPRKRYMILGGIAAAIALIAGGWMWATAGKESTDDAQIEADIVPVATRVPGQVQKLAAQDNQHVKKGDLILQLDDADYAARVAQAEAELETASAQATAADAQAQVAAAGARGGFTSARAGVTGSSAQLATAQAGLTRAEADERKAALDLQRSKELRAANVIPQSKLDDDQAAYDVARAALVQARAALEAAQSGINAARGRAEQSAPVNQAIAVAQANAKLAHARQKSAAAALDLARLQLSYTKLYAQEDGQITRLTAREGQMVQPGQPVAMLVPDRTY
ncbi:MAG: biotin/lipoyl-binding protein, partial [Myxococcales bacterium]|nr:biotin/lipoyl-binding protein [Myxococcales bacterium]